MEESNIFSGLAYCADCKRTMVLHRASTMKKSDYNFKCYTCGKRGKGECTPHHIREDELYAIILDDLRRVTHFARKKERQFAEYINRKNTTQLRQDITALQLEIETLRKRRNELTVLFKRLYEYKKKMIEWKKQNRFAHSEEDFVFVGTKNLPIEPRVFYKYYEEVLKNAGIEEADFHTLRHTFTTRCIESGMDILMVAKTLGHANVAITLNTYVHSSIDLKRIQLERLPALVS